MIAAVIIILAVITFGWAMIATVFIVRVYAQTGLISLGEIKAAVATGKSAVNTR